MDNEQTGINVSTKLFNTVFRSTKPRTKTYS